MCFKSVEMDRTIHIPSSWTPDKILGIIRKHIGSQAPKSVVIIKTIRKEMWKSLGKAWQSGIRIEKHLFLLWSLSLELYFHYLVFCSPNNWNNIYRVLEAGTFSFAETYSGFPEVGGMVEDTMLQDLSWIPKAFKHSLLCTWIRQDRLKPIWMRIPCLDCKV